MRWLQSLYPRHWRRREFLARKIALEKWGDPPAGDANEVAAEEFSRNPDLRAKGNALSFWISAESAEQAVERAALACASGFSRPEGFAVVFVEARQLRAAGIDLEETAGRTPVKDLRPFHRDAARLDGFRLAHIGQALGAARRREDIRTFTAVDAARLVAAAVAAKRVSLSELQVGLRSDVSAMPK